MHRFLLLAALCVLAAGVVRAQEMEEPVLAELEAEAPIVQAVPSPSEQDLAAARAHVKTAVQKAEVAGSATRKVVREAKRDLRSLRARRLTAAVKNSRRAIRTLSLVQGELAQLTTKVEKKASKLGVGKLRANVVALRASLIKSKTAARERFATVASSLAALRSHQEEHAHAHKELAARVEHVAQKSHENHQGLEQLRGAVASAAEHTAKALGALHTQIGAAASAADIAAAKQHADQAVAHVAQGVATAHHGFEARLAALEHGLQALAEKVHANTVAEHAETRVAPAEH